MTETAWKTIPKAENHENKIMRQAVDYAKTAVYWLIYMSKMSKTPKKRITIYVLTKLSDLKVKV